MITIGGWISWKPKQRKSKLQSAEAVALAEYARPQGAFFQDRFRIEQLSLYNVSLLFLFLLPLDILPFLFFMQSNPMVLT